MVIKFPPGFPRLSFFKTYLELLNNTKLNTILEENNATIKFILHVEMVKFSQYFTAISDRIQILSPEDVDIQELIRTSKMLITDYSSIAFDFAYQHKPIMFYQFDIDDYLTYRGSYVNMDKELPGYKTESREEFISTLRQIIEDNFIVHPTISLRTKKYFDYVDKENCRRIYMEIKRLG